MEIRNQSKTGPVVPPLADIAATMSDQIDDIKRRLLDRLNRDPASFAVCVRQTPSCRPCYDRCMVERG